MTPRPKDNDAAPRGRVSLLVHAAAAIAAVAAGCASRPATPQEEAAEAFAELRREIPRRMAEPAQQSAVAGLADALERLVGEASEARAAAATRLRALHADYDAPRADIEAVLRELREGNRRRSERALALRAEATKWLDDATWLELERFRALALRAALDRSSPEGAQP